MTPSLYRACALAYTRQEATGGVFEIKEWPEELVSRMIDYMYRGDYGEMLPEENEQGEEYEPKAKSTNRRRRVRTVRSARRSVPTFRSPDIIPRQHGLPRRHVHGPWNACAC